MQTDIKQAENDTAAALLARIAKGETKAMEDFYRTFRRTVYAFVLRRLENPVESDEVVLETMYEVWRNAGSFAGRSAPSTWLLGIARHKLLDKLRAWSTHDHAPLEDELDSLVSEEPSGFDCVARKQTQQIVLESLNVLPAEQRECLHLMFFEDYSIAEIAQIQRCPENTIKTRLFHARRKMRQVLERQSRWDVSASAKQRPLEALLAA